MIDQGEVDVSTVFHTGFYSQMHTYAVVSYHHTCLHLQYIHCYSKCDRVNLMKLLGYVLLLKNRIIMVIIYIYYTSYFQTEMHYILLVAVIQK